MDLPGEKNVPLGRLVWLLAAIPLLFAGFLIIHFGVNVPRWDEWAIAQLIGEYDAGRLTLRGLFHQQNDSRLFFPKLIYLPIALATKWDTRYLMWITPVLMGISILMMVRIALQQHRRLALTLTREHRIFIALAVFLASAIVCGTFQTALPWGYIFPVHIPFACLITALAIGESSLRPWAKHLSGILLAIIATFSYANGMALWPLLIAYYLMSRQFSGRSWWWLATWIIAAGLSFWLYFYDYHFMAKTTFSQPLRVLQGFLCFLGAPLSPPAPRPPAELAVLWGTIVGSMVVLVCLLMAWRFWRGGSESRRAGVPWLMVMGFTFVSGAVAAVGRIASGEFALMATRYASFNTYMLAAICLVASIVFTASGGRTAIITRWTIFGVIFALWAITSPLHMVQLAEFTETVRSDGAMLRFGEYLPKPPTLIAIFPNPRVYDFSRTMRNAGRLLPEKPTEAEYQKAMQRAPGGFLEREDRTAPMFSGWAYIPGRNGRPAGVVVTEVDQRGRRKAIAIARCDIERPDVQANLGTDDSRFGWQVSVRPSAGSRIEVFAVDGHSRRLYALQRGDMLRQAQ